MGKDGGVGGGGGIRVRVPGEPERARVEFPVADLCWYVFESLARISCFTRRRQPCV